MTQVPGKGKGGGLPVGPNLESLTYLEKKVYNMIFSYLDLTPDTLILMMMMMMMMMMI